MVKFKGIFKKGTLWILLERYIEGLLQRKAVRRHSSFVTQYPIQWPQPKSHCYIAQPTQLDLDPLLIVNATQGYPKVLTIQENSTRLYFHHTT